MSQYSRLNTKYELLVTTSLTIFIEQKKDKVPTGILYYLGGGHCISFENEFSWCTLYGQWGDQCYIITKAVDFNIFILSLKQYVYSGFFISCGIFTSKS